MKCQVFIPTNPRNNRKPGYCSRKDVKVIRWAGSVERPLKTRVYKLCGIHANILAANGKIDLGDKK